MFSEGDCTYNLVVELVDFSNVLVARDCFLGLLLGLGRALDLALLRLLLVAARILGVLSAPRLLRGLFSVAVAHRKSNYRLS